MYNLRPKLFIILFFEFNDNTNTAAYATQPAARQYRWHSNQPLTQNITMQK